MYLIKNIVVNLLDLTNPKFSSLLRLFKIYLNREIDYFKILSKITIHSRNVIDIGARVGFFTYVLLKLNKNKNQEFHLFEPLPLNLIILNRFFIKCPQTFIHPYALSDKNEKNWN